MAAKIPTITLDDIDFVKEHTNCTYDEAIDALKKCHGDVNAARTQINNNVVDKDVELVQFQTGASKQDAEKALSRANGDIVNAIIHLMSDEKKIDEPSGFQGLSDYTKSKNEIVIGLESNSNIQLTLISSKEPNRESRFDLGHITADGSQVLINLLNQLKVPNSDVNSILPQNKDPIASKIVKLESLSVKDIDLCQQQAKVSRKEAEDALIANNGDVILAIVSLSNK